METWGRTRRRARGTVAAAAAAALTASVLAAPVDAAVGPTRVVTVSPADGVVIVAGLIHSDTYSVTVERGGVVIGSASGSPASFGTFGSLELNHPTELFDPFCWEGVTPRMQQGDVVRVNGPGVDDSATVQDIEMLTYPEPTTGPGGVPAFKVTGTLGEGLDPAGVDVFIRLDLNPPPPGGDDDNPEPVDDDTDDWKASSSDEGNTFEAAADGTWTATFTTGFMLEDVVTPVDDAVLAAAAAPRVLQAGYSVGTPPVGENRGGNETTLALPPGAGEPVPVGCPPAADSAIGYVSPSVINTANQGSGLLVSGVSSGANVDVEVSGPGGGTPLTDTVPVLPNGTWSTSFTGPLDGLEGELVVAASHDGGPSTAPANVRRVLRDTQAPVAPVSIPGNSSFTHSMHVLLASSEAEIRYTEGDGTQAPPTATTGRRYTGSILLASTTTLKAVAVDAAKNVSPVMTRTFTKLVPALPPTPQVPPPPDGAAALVPLAPAMGKVKAGKPGGKKTATVRWRTPLANAAVVEGYQVRALKLRPGRSAKIRKVRTVDADVTKKRMVLPRGKYKFQVRALGGNGTSRWSERSAKVRPR